jgi:hypothetical protein
VPLQIIDTLAVRGASLILCALFVFYVCRLLNKSIGGSCETYTIGHNPAKLTLSKKDICLQTERPNFVCENILSQSGRRQMSLFTNMSAERNDESNESLTKHAMVSLNRGEISS